MNSSEIFLRGWHLVILGRNSPKNHPVYLFPLWCSIKVTTRIRSKKEFLEVLERIPRFRAKETQMQEVSKFKLKHRLTWLGSNKYRTNSSPNKTGKPEKSLQPKKRNSTEINPKARHNLETEEEESRIWRRKTEVFILLEPIETK